MQAGTLGAWLLLVAALIVVLPVAYATPLDPTWLGGWWDDGDEDSVVLAVVHTIGVVAGVAMSQPKPDVLEGSVCLLVPPATIGGPVYPPYQLRAPPPA
jgi:hypothetical protein